jgi:2-succinyl-5-enolpyruvyl-6-hydroxy-3-cyclohexene-1-carboxylate synthase
LRLAEEHGWPLVSEPTGNASSGPQAISTGGWLLGVDACWDELLPENILVVGRPTLSRAVNRALADPRVATFVVPTAGRWADSTRTATHVLPSLPREHGHQAADADWLARWTSAEADARKVLDASLDSVPRSEQNLVRELHAALPADALLVAGSSLPIRHLFLCARPREGVTTVANRGAAGIDGTNSTAVGAATSWQESGGGPAVALVGDLTFLHDSTGLLGDRSSEPHLTIVVLNNNGGGIFELLEQATATDRVAFEKVLGTPTGVDLAAICGATGTPFTRVADAAELSSVAKDPRVGLQVVEVRTDRGETARLHGEIGEAISASVVPS